MDELDTLKILWRLDEISDDIKSLQNSIRAKLNIKDSEKVNDFLLAFDNQIDVDGRIDTEEIDSIDDIDDSNKCVLLEWDSGENDRDENTGITETENSGE